MKDEHLVVSIFAAVSWRAGRIEVSSSTSGTVFATDDFNILTVLHAFARPRRGQEVARELDPDGAAGIAECVQELVEAGVLLPESSVDPALLHHWDPDALAFHRSSRRPDFQKRTSSTTSAVAPPRGSERIELIRRFEVEAAGTDLAAVLEARCSRRRWAARAIPFSTFSQFFWLSARNRVPIPGSELEQASDCVSRPYPSGGARYSVELYPVVASGAVDTVPAGVYRYLPDSHSIEILSDRVGDCSLFLDAAGSSAASEPPPVMIVMSSRLARQGEQYGRLAYSLVLKEVGCILQTFYCVAEYLRLAPCALGGGSPGSLLARLCGASDLAEPVVGEFMLGPRADDNAR